MILVALLVVAFAGLTADGWRRAHSHPRHHLPALPPDRSPGWTLRLAAARRGREWNYHRQLVWATPPRVPRTWTVPIPLTPVVIGAPA